MAAPRKPFSQLKPATQQRKARWYAKHQGLTAKEVENRYDNGTLGSQKASRGHARTPEKPGTRPPAPTGPGISDYERRRQTEINKIQNFKARQWGGRPKWNGGRSRRFVSNNPETGRPRGIRELKKLSAICDLADLEGLDDWHLVVALDYDEEDAFYYHLRGEVMTYEQLERVAMAFILEDAVWDLFLTWATLCQNSDDIVAWLKTASKTEVRREWMRRSGNPYIISLADQL